MKKYRLLISFLIILMVNSQAIASSDIHDYINKVKASEMQLPDSIPSFHSLAKFVYTENESRTSPFLLKTTANEITKKSIGKQYSVRQAPLEELKFVGMIKKSSKILALISYPSGELSGVVIGDEIGMNSGKIVEIYSNCLRVEEQVLVAGKWEKRTRNIYLIERD